MSLDLIAMRRTYRSKKEYCGGFDPKEVLINNDKSSAFDAFFINNIKQAKRELSTFSNTSELYTTKKRIRTKHVKHNILQDVQESLCETVQTKTTYLTPNKSFRVNKAPDLFDQLLNSTKSPEGNLKPSPDEYGTVEENNMLTPLNSNASKGAIRKFNYSSDDYDNYQEVKENVLNDNEQKEKLDASDELKQYIISTPRKRLTKGRKDLPIVKRKLKKPTQTRKYAKINVFNESISVSCENLAKTNKTDVTDLLNFDLITEQEHKKPNNDDYDIEKLLNIKSAIDRVYTSSEDIVHTPSNVHNRLTIHRPEPRPHSPLTSTPFIQKYRGKSIYKLSPINTIIGRENEIMASPELQNKIKSEICQLSVIQDVGSRLRNKINLESSEVHIAGLSIGQEIKANVTDEHRENILGKSDANNYSVKGVLEISSYEPFFGFTLNKDDSNSSDSCNSVHEKFNVTKNNDYNSSVEVLIDDQELRRPSNSDKYLIVKSANYINNISNLSCQKDAIQLVNNVTKNNNSSVEVLIDAQELSGCTQRNASIPSNHNKSLIVKSANCINNISNLSCQKDAIQLLNNVTKNNDYNSSVEVLTDDQELSGCTQMNASTPSNNNKSLIVKSANYINNISNLTYQKNAMQLNNNMPLDDKPFYDLSVNEEFPEDNVKDQEIKTDLQPNVCGKNDSTDLFDSVCESINSSCYEVENSGDVPSQHLSDELFYDANTSTMSQNTILKTFGDKNQPFVKLERLNSSYLNKYIEDANEELVLNKSSNVIRISSNNSLMDFKNSDTDKTDIEDDSCYNDFDTPDDAVCQSDENYKEQSDEDYKEQSDEENRCVSFVTTRRRNYIKNNTMFILNDSTTSSNECDETVINAITESPILKTKETCKTQNKCQENNSTFNFIEDIDLKNSDDKALCDLENIQRPSIVLQPGKKWERSLSIYKRMTFMNDNFDISIIEEEPLSNKGRHYRQSVINTMELQEHNGSIYNESHLHRRSTIVPKSYKPTVKIIKKSSSSRFSISSTKYDDTSGFLNEECDDTLVELSKLSLAEAEPDITVIEARDERFVSASATARDYVLRRCNQSEAILFDECYPESVLKNCRKIGEGVYGEVFLCRGGDGRARVMKIVPVAGNIRVNGEQQKDFQEIISEIVIAMELSALRSPIAEFERHFDEGKDLATLDLHSFDNATDAFNEVLAVKCVYGSYPSRLLDLWDLYDECKGSDNDNPAILPSDQQYIVLELANAGQDLESYQFNSAEQAYGLLIQIAYGLAVGEEAFQFEHRDLHWGNVLIAPTDQKFGTYLLRGQTHRVPRNGVAATIIDYSLSRLSLPLAAEEHAALFNDLSTDEGLFNAVGDYQFDVYRHMRQKLRNDWKNFEPYTNILWLHYTVDKMITQLRYRRTNTKIHRQYIAKLKGFKNRVLGYGSATQFVLTDIEY